MSRGPVGLSIGVVIFVGLYWTFGMRQSLVLFVAVVGLIIALAAAGPLRAQQVVDLELVLAVDTSSSVSQDEFDLQMKGLATAFRNPVIMEAVRAAGDLGVAVALIQWSDAGEYVMAIDWRVLHSPADSVALSESIDRSPRFVVGGGTAIGSAMAFAMTALSTNPYQSRRRVIDVSGDGRANQGERPDQVRDRAVLSGITINGLAILNEDPNVGRYYRENVIGGPGAFVMSTKDYEDFSRAMVEKLIREISGPPIVWREPKQNHRAATAGRKQFAGP